MAMSKGDREAFLKSLEETGEEGVAHNLAKPEHYTGEKLGLARYWLNKVDRDKRDKVIQSSKNAAWAAAIAAIAAAIAAIADAIAEIIKAT